MLLGGDNSLLSLEQCFSDFFSLCTASTTQNEYVPLGIENINSIYFVDTGLPGCFTG